MQVIITPKALRQLAHLQKSSQAKIKKKLSTLEQNPFLGKKLGGELANQYSLRAWPYRIIYIITAFKKTPDFQPGDELNADMSSSFKGNPAIYSRKDVIEKRQSKIYIISIMYRQGAYK